MRNVFLFLLLINFYSICNAQIISGTIRDQKNDSTIIFASVYINGTSIGSHSDQHGNFVLDVTKYSSMPVTISALGYYSATLSDFPKNSPFVVYLTPKLFELREVVISSKPSASEKERKRNLKLFRNEFLGLTPNALNCEITNEKDISFTDSPDNDTLKAWSSEPLLIVNRTLGYTITYFLDNFELCRKDNFLLITGNFIFKEDTTTDLSQRKIYYKKRKDAYLGSRMHFFRALWDNSYNAEGFTIKNSEYTESDYEELVVLDSIWNGERVKYLKNGGTLNITYNPKFARTRINSRDQDVFFDRSGYFDPYGITWSGDMGKQRIADLLPFDYSEYSKNEPVLFVGDTLSVIEKVYLQTDRACYYPGDDIWFKAYLVEADGRILSDHSNNLHVELISPFSKIIDNRVIRIDYGLGKGDIKLPPELPSGRYLLRAYTNYMRNFSDDLFFNKEIVVISSSENKDELPAATEYNENKIEIGFFPEGGSLVENVSSIVAFKAVDGEGKGCDVAGRIYSSTGELITTFKSTHNGMGTFFLNPVPGLNYYSIIENSAGEDIKTEIPKSFPKGVTLTVTNSGNNELLITTKTNPQTLPLVLGKNFMLNISARNKSLKTVSYKIKSLTNSFTLPTEDLPEGIVMLSLSTSEGLPVSERLIFMQINKDIRVKIEPDRLVYKQRDPVSLRISLQADSGFFGESFLSLSAAERDFADNIHQFQTSISSWFLLESDIRGYVEDPSFYFDPSNPDRLRDLDLLLRTQGWRDFRWKYEKNNYFSPETGFSISGRLRQSLLNKPIEGSKVNIGVFESRETIITTVPADTAGRFRLDGIDLTGEARVIVSGLGKNGNQQGLLLLDSLKYVPAKVNLNLSPAMVIKEDRISKFKQEFEIKESVKQKYKLSDTIALAEVNIIATKPKDLQTIKVESSRAVYGAPDDEIIINKQLEGFSNVAEILKGRVAGVRVTGMYPDYKINIRGTHTINSNGVPLVLVDGFKTSFSDLTSLPVYFIDRIDILKSGGATAMYGMEGANGVISIITRTADRVEPYESVDNPVNLKITGYNEARIFYSPQHISPSVTVFEPDLRTTLFWKPDISLKTNQDLFVEYYNADNSSTISVIVEGITSDGIPVTGKTEYEVR